jgi:hypothetical protein
MARATSANQPISQSLPNPLPNPLPTIFILSVFPLCIQHCVHPNHLLLTSEPSSSNLIIMVLDSNPGTPVSPSDAKHIINTPINTGHRTLYHFGDKCLTASDHQHKLAIKMSPYFVGPKPVSAFLEEFLPPP